MKTKFNIAKPQSTTAFSNKTSFKTSKHHAINKRENLEFDYQDTHQEKIIHGRWDKGNSYRYVLEGTGDIFRESTMKYVDKGYMSQKITRIKNHIDAVERPHNWSEMENEIYTKEYGVSPYKTKIHPEDSHEYAYMNNKEKFEEMKQQWKNQPYSTKLQKQAIDLNIAMLDKDYDTAKSIINKIEK
jgi:hypothetical protein